VAYWAHIGGFAFGMAVGALLSSNKAGAEEYALEDARKAMAWGEPERAIDIGGRLLQRNPNDPEVHEVLAHAYDELHQPGPALAFYEMAIGNYIRRGRKELAAWCYLVALQNHPRFILPAVSQLLVGNQMALQGNYANAAETLVKNAYAYPLAPEAEISLLRGAQLYVNHLAQPQWALFLLREFRKRYPASEWHSQWAQAWKMAVHLSGAREAALNDSVPARRQSHLCRRRGDRSGRCQATAALPPVRAMKARRRPGSAKPCNRSGSNLSPLRFEGSTRRRSPHGLCDHRSDPASEAPARRRLARH